MAQKAGQLGDTAKQGVSEAAGTVKEQLAATTGDVGSQVRSMVDQSRTQLRSEANSQGERLSGSMRQMGNQLHALAEGRPQDAGQMVDYTRQAADSIIRYGESLQAKGFDGLLRDTQDFARRRPGTFLLGAAVAGVVVGRFIRNAKGAGTTSSYSAEPLPPPRGQAYLAATESPAMDRPGDLASQWDPVGVGGFAP